MFATMLFTAFRVLFNVGIINTMRVNEEEVQGVSDTLPSTVKAQIKRKRPISEVLENVPACSSSYKPLAIPERSSTTQIPADIDTPEAFFALFITPDHLELIARHTNINADSKRINETGGDKGKARA